MEMIDIVGQQSHISISREELLIFNAALNEVCNGLEVFEFETRIGAERRHALALLKEMGSLLDKLDRSS